MTKLLALIIQSSSLYGKDCEILTGFNNVTCSRTNVIVCPIFKPSSIAKQNLIELVDSIVQSIILTEPILKLLPDNKEITSVKNEDQIFNLIYTSCYLNCINYKNITLISNEIKLIMLLQQNLFVSMETELKRFKVNLCLVHIYVIFTQVTTYMTFIVRTSLTKNIVQYNIISRRQMKSLLYNKI